MTTITRCRSGEFEVTAVGKRTDRTYLKYAVEAFGFLINLGNTVHVNKFSDMINEYSSHSRAKHISENIRI